MRPDTFPRSRCALLALVVGLVPTAASAQEPSREERQTEERRAAVEEEQQAAERRAAAEQDTAEQRREAATEQERADARREAAAEKERAEARRRAAAGEGLDTSLPVAEQRALATEIAHQETVHRARLAKLERLQALAEEAGRAERVAAVEELRRKELQKHERKLARLSERLGPDGPRVVERVVNHGRERRAETPAARRAALHAWEQQHPDASHGVHGRGGEHGRKGEHGAAGRGERPRGAEGHDAGGGGRDADGRGSGGRERGAKGREGGGGQDERPSRGGGRDG